MTKNPTTLAKLFDEHNEKVSDKWSIYISEYDRLFQPYSSQPVRLLEIGIQNGGSLEIWGKYFTKAIKLIGCDINPNCAQLQFDDPRITVVVADANTDETQQDILKLSPKLDLIIDDGSHQSGDIVRSFARYFTHLNNGGLYIAEDLHCSYWQDFEGGLFQPYSSIAFFKQLADTINHEHWGIDKTRTELLRSFNRQYNTRLDEVSLAHIHSIEFINSVCVVRKAMPADNVLGQRFISGTIALIDKAPLPFHGRSNIQPNQNENHWATRQMSIEEELMAHTQEIANLNQVISERDKQTSSLIKAILKHDENAFQKIFDAEWYVNKYPDVHAAGIDPYQHYITYGIFEGRVPSANLTHFIRNGLLDYLNELHAKYNQSTLLTEVQRLQLANHEKDYSERIHALNEELDRLQAENATREQTYTNVTEALRNELTTHLRIQAQREQEFAKQLLAIQQQSDAEKGELSKQHQTKIEAIQRQQAEHEWLTAERIQILNQQIHHLQTEQIRREQTHTTTLTALHRELTTLAQEQAQREQELAKQLLAIQQQSDAEKSELSQQHQTQIEASQRQRAEHEQILKAQLLAKQGELTQLSQRELDAQQTYMQSVSQLEQQLQTMRTSYTWRWTAPLRSFAQLFIKNDANLQADPRDNNVIKSTPTLELNMSANPTPRIAQSVEELLSYYDEEFVHCAYHTLLTRAPDPEGLRYYLARVRSGISKVEILAQLRLSVEGKSRKVIITGLDEAIKHHKLLKIPFLGSLLQLFGMEPMAGDTEITQPVDKLSTITIAKKAVSDWVSGFLRGETAASRKLAQGYLRFHLDHPQIGLINIVNDSCVVSGWAFNLEAHSVVKVRVRVGKVLYQPHPKQREDVQRAFASVCDLPLDVGYAAVLSLSMGLHRMSIEIEGSDKTWISVRRGLLLSVPQFMLVQLKQVLSYKAFKAFNIIEQKHLEAELFDITRHIDVMLHKPIFTVVIDTRQGLVGWKKSLQSIGKQIYPHYELRVLASDGAKLPAPLQQGAKPLQDISLTDVLGDFIVFIESGQSLSSNALYEFANAINQYPDLDLIYGDEDRLNAYGKRYSPAYKPDWSPDYLETFNYIGFPTCFRTTVARGCFDNAHLYDFVLRFTERTTKVWHVAKILGHAPERRVDNEALERTAAQNITFLQGRLNRTGRHGTVREHELHRGCYDIQLNLKREPLVSVIIPTAGKRVTVGERRIDLITNVIDQIRNQSTYKNIEIIVVDNGDLSERQHQVLTDQGCKRITYTEPVFNISKKLNLGASIANGELFLLMNDDIEILSPPWIERMVEHFEKPHVGVVGAKLLFPDGRIQHAGVVHNHGDPDHVRRLFPRDDAGYYFSTCGVRNFMGVTGAVMMTLSNIYREVGGYSEELAVSFNDIDYCLKVQENGLRTVYAPKVELIHMESLSRVAFMDMSEYVWYKNKWAPHTTSDPYYNEKFLMLAPPTFVPCVNQRLV